jgi:hypothetical protein
MKRVIVAGSCLWVLSAACGGIALDPGSRDAGTVGSDATVPRPPVSDAATPPTPPRPTPRDGGTPPPPPPPPPPPLDGGALDPFGPDPVSCPDMVLLDVQIKNRIDAPPPRGVGPRRSTPPSPAVCSDADLSAIDAAVLRPGATVASILAVSQGRNPACAACLFTDVSSVSWGPFILRGTEALTNTSAVLQARGADDACATAYHYFERCLEVLCSACSASDRGQCEQDQFQPGSVCSTAFEADATAKCNRATLDSINDDIQSLLGPPYNFDSAVAVYGKLTCGAPL